METEYFETYYQYVNWLILDLDDGKYDNNPNEATYYASNFVSDNDQETVMDTIEYLLMMREIKDRESDRLYYESIFRTDDRDPEIEYYVPCHVCGDGIGFWEADGDPSDYAKKYGFERVEGKNVCGTCRGQ